MIGKAIFTVAMASLMVPAGVAVDNVCASENYIEGWDSFYAVLNGDYVHESDDEYYTLDDMDTSMVEEDSVEAEQSEYNMVNYNFSTGSISYEYFDETEYASVTSTSLSGESNIGVQTSDQCTLYTLEGCAPLDDSLSLNSDGTIMPLTYNF